MEHPEDNHIDNQENLADSLHSTPEEELQLKEAEMEMIQSYLNAVDIWQSPHKIPNFSYLGDVIETIIHAKFPPPPRPGFPPGPHYFPLKVCIMGSQFSGKHTYAKALELKYGLKVFEIDKVLEDRNKVLERKQELEEGKKPKKPQEDESEIFVEECVNSNGDSSKEKAKLLRAKLRGVFGDEAKAEEEVKKPNKKEEVKCQGWIVLSYPKTETEAEDLEYELSGYIDPKNLPPTTAHLKKQEALIIAEPSGLTERKPPLEKSVFDIIIKLEVPSHILVRRAVDRRVDASGNVYNLTFNPPPDNLLPKLKIMEHPNEEEILKSFEEYNAEKTKLSHWMQKFGVNEWSAFLHVNETKIDLVKEMIEKKVQEWFKVREEMMNSGKSEDTKLEFRDLTCVITRMQAKVFYKHWINLKNSYIQDIKAALSTIQTLENDLKHSNDSLLKKFQSFLCRPDHKQTLIDPFLDRLSKLLDSRAIITSRSRKNMLDELDNLSDQLWDIIEGRKEENIKYFEKLQQQDPCLGLVVEVLLSVQLLIQAEVNKFNNSMKLISEFQEQVLKKNDCFKFVEENIDFGSDSSPGQEKLVEFVGKAQEFVERMPECECKDEAKSLFLLRIEQIQSWAEKTLYKISMNSKNTFLMMDKWIGDAVKAENEFVNELIVVWKDAVRDRRNAEKRTIQGNIKIAEFLTWGV